MLSSERGRKCLEPELIPDRVQKVKTKVVHSMGKYSSINGVLPRRPRVDLEQVDLRRLSPSIPRRHEIDKTIYLPIRRSRIPHSRLHVENTRPKPQRDQIII